MDGKVYSTILETLMADANYETYAASMHFESHQRRGGSPADGCKSCDDHEQAARRTSDALSVFLGSVSEAA